jgi:hypothetical protein
MIYLRYQYTWNMPLTAHLGSGRTIPVTLNYGRVVYVTEAENLKLIYSYIFTGLGGSIAVLYAVVRANFPDRAQAIGDHDA